MFFPVWLAALFTVPATAVFNIDNTPNAVGICYSVWQSLGYNGQTPPPDITEIQNGVGTFAAQGVFHFWGRPDGGYYAGGNRSVLDRHFSQITGANIDFIVIDATNLAVSIDNSTDEHRLTNPQGYGGYQVGLFTEPTDVLLDEMMVQRAAGQPTPSVVFWVGSAASDADPSAVGRFVNDRYYSNSNYDDFWVIFDGKFLMLTTDTVPSNLAQNFTLRKMWGLQSSLANGEWSFLQDYPQNVGTTNGVAEEVSVCTAKQATYMSDEATATSREEGATFQTQWQRAFSVRPKVVMLTWWNEWMAQRQANDANGQPQFVDEYDGEYSRDIEPQDPSQPTSHGSHYYEWTQAYVSAYKANQGMPGGLTGY